MTEKKADIRDLDLTQLRQWFVDHKEQKFRANQVWEWLWKKGCHSFDEMSNLSKSTRQVLADNFRLESINLTEQQISKDKTIKLAFQAGPTQVFEGVLIPTASRMTACISSQVGCSLACKFCATGKLKLLKNLSP